MFGELLEKRGISAYALSKKTSIPYSTIADILSDKTDIQNVSAKNLYALSKALDMTMEQLYLYKEDASIVYLYNDGRMVNVSIGRNHFSYMGPKNLLGFKMINGIHINTVYVETYFTDKKGKIYTEEDYIDLEDVLGEDKTLLSKSYTVKIGNPKSSKSKILTENAVMIVDGLAVTESDLETDELVIEVTNLRKNKEKSLIRLKDYAVLYSTMSSKMQKKAVESTARNRDLIIEEIEERTHAKVHK